MSDIESSLDPVTKAAADALRTEGYALLGEVLPPTRVRALLDELPLRLPGLDDPDVRLPSSVYVGHRRQMVTVRLSGAFAAPEVYANPKILSVMNAVLERSFILENFGLVVSFPGAGAQSEHRDGRYLFEAGVAVLLPAHAVTVAIPLVDMDRDQGTTELVAGSHRPGRGGGAAPPPIVPNVAAGECVIWDYRTLHRGTENRSSRCRPLLYLTYSKPWWRDLGNFRVEWRDGAPQRSRPPLLFGTDFWTGVPDELRFLFQHVDDPQRDERR